jgi:hypothetical protein
MMRSDRMKIFALGRFRYIATAAVRDYIERFYNTEWLHFSLDCSVISSL